MQSIVKKLLASSLFLLLPLLTGCGKAGNPMSPDVPQAAAPESVDVTVKLVSLYTVADGDGIEGAGEFTFTARVDDGAPGTLITSSGGILELDTGSSYMLNKARVIRIPKGQDYRIRVDFWATEWDVPLFGGPADYYPDSRLDNVNEFRVHSNGGRDGFDDGERWITLGDYNDLRLRLIYTVTSKPVPVL